MRTPDELVTLLRDGADAVERGDVSPAEDQEARDFWMGVWRESAESLNRFIEA